MISFGVPQVLIDLLQKTEDSGIAFSEQCTCCPDCCLAMIVVNELYRLHDSVYQGYEYNHQAQGGITNLSVVGQ